MPTSVDLFAPANLMAWCIVPYDSVQRTPPARIAMLKRLGFTQYAYDWREQHLDALAEEIQVAMDAGVHMAAVWMWFDKDHDAPGKLSANNQRMLNILKASGLRTQLWLGFNSNYLDGQDHAAKVQQAVDAVGYLRQETADFITGVGLYNHGDWFGEPEHQIDIIQALADPKVGIVYNWHHGHPHLDRFAELHKVLQPYLWAVNLNGMRRAGPKILSIGSGDDDLTLLRTLVDSGFHGHVGVLGHIEEEDAEVVLTRNLQGLRQLVQALPKA